MGDGKNFEDFVGLYSLSKTLRFELKPVGKTKENIKEENWVLERDEQRNKDYIKIKPLFDKLHDEFIQESLSDVKIDWSDFYDFYVAYKSKMRNKSALSAKDLKQIWDEFESRQKKLRKDIVELYKKTADEWKSRYINDKWKAILKEKWYKILTENKILKVLEEIYEGQSDELDVIKNFDWFFTYFVGFNQNRENYYDDWEKSTAVAYRIVNQNFLTFCNNVLLKEKIVEIGLSDDEKQIFETNLYNKCLNQQGIDIYNEIIWGKKDEKWIRISDGINQKLNEYAQKNKKKMPQLKILYKQIGSLKAKTIPFDLVETDEELKNEIKKFIKYSNEYNPLIKEFIKEILEKQIDLDKIWISKSSLNWISNIFFASWFAMNEIWLEQWLFKKKKNKDGDEEIKIPEYVSLEQIKNLLEAVEYIDQSDLEEEKRMYLFKKDYEHQRGLEKNNWKFFIEIIKAYFRNLFEDEEYGINNSKKILEKIVDWFDKTNSKHKNNLKLFADKNLDILRYLRLFRVDPSKLIWGELSGLYNDFDKIVEEYPIHKLYDVIRNYITKKPYSADKMKLNFNCSTLLAGWDKNKETQNLSVLLKDEENYYLAIMKKDNNKFFDKSKNSILYDKKGDLVYKMDYSFWSDVSKMIPKCSTQLKAVINSFRVNKDDFIFPVGYKVSSG